MKTSRHASLLAGLASILALAAIVAAPPGDAQTTQAAPQGPVGQITIEPLSSHRRLVSGGDVLVEITAQDRQSSPMGVAILVNGEPAKTKEWDTFESYPRRVLVSGLRDGENVIEAVSASGSRDRMEVVNHPRSGPILSGPHLKPYECRTEESGLGRATDANCSAPTRYDWFYRTTGGEFKPLDNTPTLPADIAYARRPGSEVPYIVRVETGVINRSIYRIAVLSPYLSSKKSGLPMLVRLVMRDRADNDSDWNGRLAVSFGGGCGANYNQGQNDVKSVLSDLYLSRGFAYMNATELVNQLHCNQVLQGETLMMLKEHFIESYGIPAWTVGTGGSGGAIQQMVIAQMYPGLLDGLQPSLAFPDSSMQTADCGLLQKFFREDGKDWSQAKKSAVEGYSPGTCSSWERSFVRTIQAGFADGCGLKDKSLVYDPKTNPKGVRCTTQEMRANIYGRDPATGFARRPLDNVGVEYGLNALNAGAISVDEFLTLNEKVGGNDIDGGFQPGRTVGDEQAIRAIYESGLFNTFANLDRVPILNYRAYTDTTTPGDIHDRHRDLTIRARLEKTTGHSGNQVIWVADRPAERSQPAKVDLAPIALDVMTRWLDAMAADRTPPGYAKVVRNKPRDAVDAYWTPEGQRVNEEASWDPSTSWNKTYPVHLEPRLVAGAPKTNDVMKCQLKPVDFAAYKVTFTVAQQARMKSVFPDGVCDWTKPSLGYSTIRETYRKY